MATETKGDGRTVQLRGVRLSFTDSLYEKQATVENGIPKHSANMILETGSKFDEANRRLVGEAIRKACEKAFKNPEAWKQIAEDDPKRICYRKGERFKNKEQVVYAGYTGNMAISGGTPGKGQKRPKLLNRHKQPVEESAIMDVFYGGTYADVMVSFYGTDKGGRGVFCTIEAIRSHQEGEPMGGGVHVDADDFDDIDGDDAFDNAGSSSSVDDFEL